MGVDVRCRGIFRRLTPVLLLVAMLGSLSTAALIAPAVPSAKADTLVTTVPIAGAVELAADSQTDRVYVTDGSEDSVSVVSGSSDSVIATISLPSYAAAVAVDPATDYVYVTDGGSSLFVIDGSTDALTATVALPINGADSVAVDPDTGVVYVVSLDNQLAVVNGSSDKVTTSLDLENTYATDWVAVDPSTNMVYVSAVTNYDGGGTLTVFDGATDTVTGQVTFNGANGYSVDVNPQTDVVYVAGGNATYVFDGSTDVLTGTIALTSVGAAMDTATGKMYITNDWDPGSVFVVNATTDSVEQTIQLGNGTFDTSIDQTTDAVYIVNDISHSLSVIDGSDQTTVEVASQNTAGDPITGYYTILYNSTGSPVAMGFTPHTFTVDAGSRYSVKADGYEGCTFSQWSDGVTANPRPFNATGTSVSFTAVYLCTGSGPTVTVSSVNQSGDAISGYYVTLYEGGTTVDGSGFTNVSFPLTQGQSYAVQADSYGSCNFSGWSGYPSAPERMSFTATGGSQQFTAVYDCTG